MNSRRNSIALGLLVLIVAGGLFIALRPGESDETTASSQTITTPEAEVTTGETAPSAKPPKPEMPKVTTIVVRGGEPVGGVLDIDVTEGDRIRFNVKSDVEEEVHVHGFDITEDVAPGKTASLDFGADFTGIFEAELEFSGVPIAEIQINP